jgi:hypothetical protein
VVVPVGRRWSTRLLFLLAAAGSLPGCSALDDLLDVDLSGKVTEENAEIPGKAAALVEGGIALFNCALTRYIIFEGVLGDELFAEMGSWNDIEARAEFRVIETNAPLPNCGVSINSFYGNVAQARWQNDHVLELLEGWSDAEVANRSALIARAAAYSGYSHLLLAEGFCTAALDGGPEIQSIAVFERAAERFARAVDAATSAGASSAETLNLARVGRARALAGLNRLAEAKTVAAQVPVGFVKLARYPGTLPQSNDNLVQWWTHVRMGVTVDAQYRNRSYGGVADTRVAVVNTGLVRQGIPIWTPSKYSTATSPIEIATWQEAQLIVAEAEVAAGNLAAAVAIIDNLHSRLTPALPPFSGNASSATEVLAQIIAERRAELFLEGQHIGDYRRFQLPFVPAPGTPNAFSGSPAYGSFRCFPLPAAERNSNPNVP